MDDKARETEASRVILTPETEEVSPSETSVALTQELFDLHVFSIREYFRTADKKMELAILDQNVTIRNGGEVVLGVMGHMQEEIAGKMKPDLVGLIRKFTGVDRVMVTIELKEEVENGKPKLYTNSDKFNYLKKNHPALVEFQRKFGLEVDF